MDIRSTKRPRPSQGATWAAACGLVLGCVLACSPSETVPAGSPASVEDAGTDFAGTGSPNALGAPRIPESRGGRDLVGKDAREVLPAEWFQVLAPPVGTGDARALLIRWWTVNCPHCRVSLPAIESLRGEFESKGLATLAVFHPKPPRAVDVTEARESAFDLGYGGPVAVDPEWAILRDLWLNDADRGATSASFLVDATGTIRFVHPGPQFQRSDDPSLAADRADFDALLAAIEALTPD
tara:strand:+ start:5809 stop:6525 length:717 start_codon:yes stop_codon:yes gene_type:complete